MNYEQLALTNCFFYYDFSDNLATSGDNLATFNNNLATSGNNLATFQHYLSFDKIRPLL
jgi:hypothetical protein